MTEENQPEIKMIPVAKLEISPLNPREDRGDLLGLYESMKSGGQYDPCKVRPKGDETYEIYRGSRRFLVKRDMFHENKVECEIHKNKSDVDVLQEVGAEESTSKNFSILEKARHIRKLKEKSKEEGEKLTDEEIGNSMGISRVRVGQLKEILKWPRKIRKAMRDRKLSEKKGRIIYRNMILFGAKSDKIKDKLNQGNIPEELKNKFKKKDHELSENATLSGKNGKWEIVSDENVYNIFQEDSRIYVEENVKPLYKNLEKEIKYAKKVKSKKTLEKRYEKSEKENKITKSLNPKKYKKVIDDKKIQTDEQLQKGDTIIIKSKKTFRVSKVKPNGNYEIEEAD